MERIKYVIGLLIYVLCAVFRIADPSHAAETKAIEVGRIYHIEGELLRYVPETNDWVALVKDAPFGAEDTLFSGSDGKAEMIVPNGTWIRTGNNTQIQFIALEAGLSDIDVASGAARFYNRGTDTVIRARSPFGYVMADPGTVFDLYVGENSVEAVAIKGTVSFISSSGDARYQISAGTPSILADQYSLTTGDGTPDPAWARWNEKRDIAWAAKTNPGPSAEYLPAGLRYDAECLDTHGRWEQVMYEGQRRWFWRPTSVYIGWSPFTVGVWTEWWGDQTWIPAEPFGYVTHHYGNWVYIGDLWYWAPPVVSVRAGLPVLDVGFFWYPGRVGWIHRGIYVGWIPLAPREIYYSHRDWGDHRHCIAVNKSINHVNINIRNYTHIDRAVIVNNRNFHGVKDYRDVRVVNVHPTIIDKYSAAPVVNNTVINNYETNRKRYEYTNKPVKERPRSTVLNRVKENETVIRQVRKENTEEVREHVKSVKEKAVTQPQVTTTPRSLEGQKADAQSDRIIRADRKTQQKTTAPQMEQRVTLKPGQVEKKATQSGIVTPVKQVEPEKAAVRNDRKENRNQGDRAAIQPEEARTSRSSQVERSVTQPNVIVSGKQDSTVKTAVRNDQVTVRAAKNERTQTSTRDRSAKERAKEKDADQTERQ